jgi:phage terminase large subunit-like protein
MAWAVVNARVEPKGIAILVTKQASGAAKIDPLMAVLNLIALMVTKPHSSQPSITWI